MATTNAASEDFMSAAPRPYRNPSRTVGANASEVQASSGPVGTTSVWPAKHTAGRTVPRRAQRLVTPFDTSVSQRKPARVSRVLRISWQPASSGVCERRAISLHARSNVAVGPIVVTTRGNRETEGIWRRGLRPSTVAVQELRIDLEL